MFLVITILFGCFAHAHVPVAHNNVVISHNHGVHCAHRQNRVILHNRHFHWIAGHYTLHGVWVQGHWTQKHAIKMNSRRRL